MRVAQARTRGRPSSKPSWQPAYAGAQATGRGAISSRRPERKSTATPSNLRRRFKLVNANDNWYLRGITDDRAVPDCIANGV
jgi:hypothetical protein